MARAGPIGTSWRGGLRGEPGRPVAFLAFDLLHLDGRSLLSQPLVRRREALRRVLRPGDEVVAVPAIATEGIALFEAVVAQGDRRDPGPPAVEPLPARASAAGCGGSSPRGRGQGRGRRGRWRPDGRRGPARLPGAAAAPVLALISRLPLDED